MGKPSPSEKLRSQIDREALDLGFDVCRVTKAKLPEEIAARLNIMVAKKRHGSMNWLETTLARRGSPEAMWDGAKSAIILCMNYAPDYDPLQTLKQADRATISVYARNRDYHELVKGKLKQLAGKLAKWSASEVKVFVDTAPLMEKPLAAQAGIGWQGKHTNLVSTKLGSWFFLGVILSAAELETDEQGEESCGSCQACLDICPTNAFPAPFQLDARRCISYLTIEHAGPIDLEFRAQMGNRIYGCDDCLAVCPWNKFAYEASEAKLIAREDLKTPELAQLLLLDDAAFRKFFSGSPIKRIGRDRFIRNVLIATGNSKLEKLIPKAAAHLADENPIIRGAAIWALSQLCSKQEFQNFRDQNIVSESDEHVLEEWNRK